MYAYGRRHSSYKKQLTIFFVFVLGLGMFGVYLFYKSDTKDTISNNDALLTKVTDDREGKVTFNQKDFKISLPADWQMYQRDEGSKGSIYYIKSTKKGSDGRNMNIYVDGNTSTIAVNRVLPLAANKNQLSLGQLSDTCANFVGVGNNIDAHSDQKLPDTIAKWQNISFLCDLSHKNRNMIGTSSVDGINSLNVEGLTGNKHRFFFTYTDHNNTTDYTILSEALKTFEAK